MAKVSVRHLENGQFVTVDNVEIAVLTNVGLRREHNEDNYYIFDPQGCDTTGRGMLFAVADGMGGHAAGETASRIAVETLRSYYTEAMNGSFRDALERCILDANARIYGQAQTSPILKGMGTTLTVAVLSNTTLNVGQIGDSRAYLIRAKTITQLTDDHSLVAEQIRQGLLTEEEAANHPARNIITRALGTKEKVEADYSNCTLEVDDRVLVCSDGLHGVVTNEQILEIALAAPDSAAACEQLIARANEGGGPDNITAILVHLRPIRPFWKRLLSWR
ncbi:MAG: Stp1/IreP family PP2C-type Ser/Thr phosphatase [Candidatus Wallbacteria bacterium]|nr:Stp1/IreP family PP2C-type Ser/Thr phosphatase [Candidatus Wallbacteria bacterium]